MEMEEKSFNILIIVMIVVLLIIIAICAFTAHKQKTKGEDIKNTVIDIHQTLTQDDNKEDNENLSTPKTNK